MAPPQSIRRSRSIADAFADGRTKGNNLDGLRLLAAALVIVSHSFEIAGGAGAPEPLRALTGGQMSLGGVAVAIFFALSGFLLTASWRADPSLVRFGWRRGLRIAPALGLVVVISVFVLGPLASTFPVSAYFASAETWTYLANLGLYTKHDSLPGVFESLPYPGTINGPLWTLKFEVLCYLSLAALGWAQVLRPWVCGGFLAVLYLINAAGGEGTYGGGAYYLFQFADLARAFFAGALLALIGRSVPLHPALAGLSLLSLVAAAFAGMLEAVFPVAGAYLVLWAGLRSTPFLRNAGRFGDFSYGLYLWGWPLQQLAATAAASALLPPGWLMNAALALPLALGCAFLSWRGIERPALRLKDRALTFRQKAR